MEKKRCFLVLLVTVFIFFVTSQSTEAAAHIDPDMAIKVILGEAADQGLDGMIAVAEVIRNRGKLRGFSSMRRNLDKFASQQPQRIQVLAERAWKMSRYTNYTNGATHFDNVDRFGMPVWAHGMIRTAKVADMIYFREPS